MSKIFTTGDLEKKWGVPVWTLRRLFDDGSLPTPTRVGLFRVVSAEDLPQIEKVLRERGLLKEEPAHAS